MDWLPLSYFYTNTELTNLCVSITWTFGPLKKESHLQSRWSNGDQMTQIYIKPSKYRRYIWYSDNACDEHLSSGRDYWKHSWWAHCHEKRETKLQNIWVDVKWGGSLGIRVNQKKGVGEEMVSNEKSPWIYAGSQNCKQVIRCQMSGHDYKAFEKL